MKTKKKKVFVPNKLQAEALVALRNTTQKRGVVVLPTGTGKTFLSAVWYHEILSKDPNATLLFLCHNKDILSQANEKEFQHHLENMNIDFGYYINSKKHVRHVTFATVQTLTRNLNEFDPQEFDYIIVDEAHHYEAKTYKKVLEFFTPKFLLGLTATPNRMDGKDITETCGDIIYATDIHTAINQNILTKVNYYCVDNDIDFADLPWNYYGYKEKDLNRKLCIKEFDEAIISEYKQHVQGKRNKTIVFCATVEHAKRMSKVFNDNGINAISFSSIPTKPGERPRGLDGSKRNKLLRRFKEGEVEVVCVVNMFNEGIDVPDADCIMMLRPTKSHTIFTQQIGRGLRKAEGKEDVLILDFIGNAHRCEINFEVLSEIFGEDLLEKIQGEPWGERGVNEIVFESVGCSVRLTQKKVDILNDRGFRISSVDVRRYFLELAEKLGRTPTGKEFEEYTGIHYSIFARRFGSINKFIASLGLEPPKKSKLTKEGFEALYVRLKNELGRTPLVKDLQNEHSSAGNFCRETYGSYADFLEEMGDEAKKGYHRKAPTKKQLIEYYHNLKKELGRPPQIKELETYSWNDYQKHWGNLTKFKQEHDKEDTSLAFRTATKQDLIKNYYQVKKKLGRRPKSTEMAKEGLYGNKTYARFFGTWSKFLLSIDEDLTKHNRSRYHSKPTRKQLIENYKQIKQKLGKQPQCGDMAIKKGSKYTVKRYADEYGTWVDFLEMIGENARRLNIQKGTYIKELKRIRKELGKIPTYSDFLRNSKYSFTDKTYKKFNTTKWKEVLAQAFKKEDIKSLELWLDTTCPRCDKDFKTRKSSPRKYCSMECWKNVLCEGSVDKECLNCNTPFTVIKKRKNTAKFCSKKCYHESKRDPMLFPKKVSPTVKVIEKYTPIAKVKTPKVRRRTGTGTMKFKKTGYKHTPEKDPIRTNILKYIKVRDRVFMLESPRLSALKTIQSLRKKPQRIVIPNHLEFRDLHESMTGLTTRLNIEIYNCSALQYLVDHDDRFDFYWLDYNGAFTSYKKDLDVVLGRELDGVRLFLTYSVADLLKRDASYYFAKVMKYVMEKTQGDYTITLLEDVSYKYKKTMYNLGFAFKRRK